MILIFRCTYFLYPKGIPKAPPISIYIPEATILPSKATRGQNEFFHMSKNMHVYGNRLGLNHIGTTYTILFT
ncbi:hypothetical protein Q2T41_06385 [Maribacter confluentis]|uniref:Uncharacterized protein n=1 Tax=Maribacter confluentis TaxID=1656093 RepID=A0ABT8RNA2_9FLAO|nr:hypothetical protein [Maribacter confluentis]MDO1512280.1 hypothetical protein [Maribacter confluentis]